MSAAGPSLRSLLIQWANTVADLARSEPSPRSPYATMVLKRLTDEAIQLGREVELHLLVFSFTAATEEERANAQRELERALAAERAFFVDSPPARLQ